VSERFPGAYFAARNTSYGVRWTLHVLTMGALTALVVSVGALFLMNDTGFQGVVNHVTPRNSVGDHEQLAAVITSPQLLFMLLVAAVVSVLLVAAGGLRRAVR